MKNFLLMIAIFVSPVSLLAQSGGLMGETVYQTSNGQPLTLRNASFTYQPAQEPRSYKVHDWITVIVDEQKKYSNNNDGQRQRKITGKMGLTDWIKFPGWGQLPEPIETSPPVVGGILDHQARNKGQLTRTERLNFKIQCQVIDVLPNGNLRIKGQKQQIVGEEESTVYLSGIVIPSDIQPDNTIKSENVGEYFYNDISAGNTFDGIKRGYGQRWIDRWMPF